MNFLQKKAESEIRTNTEVTPEYVNTEAPDALIISIGSEPFLPPISGLTNPNVIVVNDYYLKKDMVSEDVIVLGGGLAGGECAIHLGMEGKKVQLIEMRDTLAPDANIRHRPLLLNELKKYVTTYTGLRGIEVKKDGILCSNSLGKNIFISGSTVICALGQRTNRTAVHSLLNCAPFCPINWRR